MYSHDPVSYEYKPVSPVRMWPYILVGVLIALAFWAYQAPITEHAPVEAVSLGPDSPWSGPIR